ncbi:MAG: hypothetical protein M1814_002426 [Vezdaea aestivalis]|nr:MAG: hypothetical protein M1814_002426 [Vezdaea aestivalis]
MRVIQVLLPIALAASASLVHAASSWGFDEAIISIQGKDSPPFKDKLDDGVPLSNPVTLGASANCKIVVTATENRKAKRPHQAFLLVREMDSGLEASFGFSMKDSGKGKVEFSQKDLPSQFQGSSQPLRATLVLASFGSSTPFTNHVFNLILQGDAGAAPAPPLRYKKLPEIHHIFRSDPKSPPRIITLFFTLGMLAIVPGLFIAWTALGANSNHLSSAMGAAPISHALFAGSILGLEGIFFMYYTSWNLFQTLPPVAVVGLVAFVSGSRALTEVQERRLAGKR